MMDYDLQLKLQAWVDGELTAREAAGLERRFANDPEAQGLAAELRMTSAALAGFEEGIMLPEPPELFWSRIRRQIELEPRRLAPRDREPLLAGWRRWLAPAAALAAGLAAVLLLARSDQQPHVETALADTGAFTYYDFPARTTLVWLSYPAEEEQAAASQEGETLD